MSGPPADRPTDPVATALRPTIQQALRSAVQAGPSDPTEVRLAVETLLADTLGVNRAGLYARLNDPLPAAVAAAWRARLARYRAGEPVAYLVGHREFFGLDLIVTPAVLIPRPETEMLVEAALAIRPAGGGRWRVADIGTGSGAIALALASRWPDLTLYATDISPAALAVARQNAARLGLANRLIFCLGDLAEALPEPVDLIVANLPYVHQITGRIWAETAGWEPDLALAGGPDGRRVIERFLATVEPKVTRPGTLLLEIGAGQGAAVLALAERHLAPCRAGLTADPAGHDRVVRIDLGPANRP